MANLQSIDLNHFIPVEKSLFFSRNDVDDPRFGDLTRSTELNGIKDLETKANVLVGYPDDEGIRVNGGRIGASKAPDTVRKYLYKMTPPLLGVAPPAGAGVQADNGSDLTPKAALQIFDLGNLSNKGDLLSRHELAQSAASQVLQAGSRWISIGGGHDYGFPDAAAYIEWASAAGERPLILNFDAHLDVRSMERGVSSGTPFFRMLEKYPDVDFAEIGIQTQCNSRAHLAWAQTRGVRVLTQEEVLISGQSFATQVLNLLGDWLLKPRSVFLSIDIDGFTSMAAPGCSQSWSTGFSPQEFFSTLAHLLGRLDVRALGVYEVSPPLDRDDQTSKLAAQIIHRVVCQ